MLKHTFRVNRSHAAHLSRPQVYLRHFRPLQRKFVRGYVLKPTAALRSESTDALSNTSVQMALKNMDKYCSRLPQDSMAAIECWEAYNYFYDEAMESEVQCEIETFSGNKSGEGCNNFLQWESFIRQIEASGGAKQMIETILVVKKAKDEQMKQSSPVQAIEDSEKAQTRELCRQLFEKHDKNQDGRIDVEEFRSLMKLLGDEVHGDTISMMFEAMDIHGSLDFEEFLTILEAEAVRSHTADVLRLSQKHGHYNDKPKWIDNL